MSRLSPYGQSSEPFALGHIYGDTESLSDSPAKITTYKITKSILRLRLCEILQNDNSMRVMMAAPPYRRGR